MMKRDENTALSSKRVRVSAAMPDTTGAAMDVPSQAAYPSPGIVESTSTPGAITSYSILFFALQSQLEKLANQSPFDLADCASAITPST